MELFLGYKDGFRLETEDEKEICRFTETLDELTVRVLADKFIKAAKQGDSELKE